MTAIERHARGLALLLGAATGLSLHPGLARAQVMDDKTYTFVLFDLIEYRPAGDANAIVWDMVGWVGGDFTRLWFKTEGSKTTADRGGDADLQLLYSKLITPFWELQTGIRFDLHRGTGLTRSRFMAVIGLEGLAPYWFEVEPALFLSQDGDLSARVTASYDLFVTQRLLLQPRLETNVAVQSVPEFGVGGGLNDISLGLRLRYEIRREFAPYLGLGWHRQLGGTASLSREAGEETSIFGLLTGLRVWF